MAFSPDHPKKDQNPKCIPLSETTSIPAPSIWEDPPPPPRVTEQVMENWYTPSFDGISCSNEMKFWTRHWPEQSFCIQSLTIEFTRIAEVLCHPSVDQICKPISNLSVIAYGDVLPLLFGRVWYVEKNISQNRCFNPPKLLNVLVGIWIHIVNAAFEMSPAFFHLFLKLYHVSPKKGCKLNGDLPDILRV